MASESPSEKRQSAFWRTMSRENKPFYKFLRIEATKFSTLNMAHCFWRKSVYEGKAEDLYEMTPNCLDVPNILTLIPEKEKKTAKTQIFVSF